MISTDTAHEPAEMPQSEDIRALREVSQQRVETPHFRLWSLTRTMLIAEIAVTP